MLEASGVKLPKVLKTGTTIVGLCYKVRSNGPFPPLDKDDVLVSHTVLLPLHKLQSKFHAHFCPKRIPRKLNFFGIDTVRTTQSDFEV
jgi:hypothetical protein